jgi:UPF0148 protein
LDIEQTVTTMPSRKEDDIMAEALLKGGKMLEKSCRTCGCPLFEIKGKTFCVVCAEDEKEILAGKVPVAASAAPAKAAAAAVAESGHVHGHDCTCSHEEDDECGCEGEGVMLADDLAETILSLCERIQNERDPENVLLLMNAVKAGTESLEILCKL